VEIGEQQDGEADRQVDEEDPVPAQGVGEDTAEDLADRGPGRAREGEHGDGAGAFGRLGEQGDQDAEGHGGAHRAADALREPGGDQHGGRAGRSGHQ